MRCCGCGFSHRLNFRIVRDKAGRAHIQFQAFGLPQRKRKR
jgi:hypothetical protein